MRFYILLITLFSCADIFIPINNDYKSIYLDGNAWIEIENQYDCDNGLRVFDNDFLMEIYFSGGENPTNDAGVLFSFLGKATENFDDINCNGNWDTNEDFNDLNGNGQWDNTEDLVDNEYIVLAISNDPSNSNILSFYVNNERQEIEIDNANFTDSEEFHLLQIFSYEGTIYFNIDNSLVYSVDDNIMIQDESLIIGALANESSISNLWYGHIDEIRLWGNSLTDEIRTFHYEYPDKLIDTMQNNIICNLIGLWTFNYSNPSENIDDEKCNQINALNNNSCNCNLPLDGILYTFPGFEVTYSSNQF